MTGFSQSAIWEGHDGLNEMTMCTMTSTSISPTFLRLLPPTPSSPPSLSLSLSLWARGINIILKMGLPIVLTGQQVCTDSLGSRAGSCCSMLRADWRCCVQIETSGPPEKVPIITTLAKQFANFVSCRDRCVGRELGGQSRYHLVQKRGGGWGLCVCGGGSCGTCKHYRMPVPPPE